MSRCPARPPHCAVLLSPMMPAADKAASIPGAGTTPRRLTQAARLAATAAATLLLLGAGMAKAQIQRGFVNTGFELPSAGATTCVFIIGADAIPGWNTTHPVASGAQPASYCPPNITAATPGATGGGLIEIWANGGAGAPSLAGTQHAELNAYVVSRLSQSVCLINGETVSFSLGHRGRASASVPDVAEFNIDSNANTVLQASTENDGGGGVVQCGNTVVAPTNGPVAGANDGAVVTPSCSSVIATSGWRRYSGTFTWNGSSGAHDFGLASISAAGGSAAGNFFDDMNITLRPVIELSSGQFSSREGQPSAQPQLLVVGTVPAGGIPVSITVVAGTATLGSDYTTTSTFTIPAGVYQTPTAVPLTGLITVIDDTIIEDNETLSLQIQTSAAYVLGSTATCNAAAQATTTYTIVDNDVDVRTTKSVVNANPPAGGTATFNVTFQNNTARPTVDDLTAHDATVNLADALPAGFSAFAWTCSASGTPAPACPAPSGSGAIATTATLPAGNAGAAGGTLTYSIVATLAPTQCAAVSNSSGVTTIGQVAEATAAQAGFVTPVPGGTANNSASAGVDPGCLSLSKTTLGLAGGPFTFTLANTSQASGSVTTAAVATPTPVDGNASAGTQPFGISAAGSDISIAEGAAPVPFVLASASCSNGSGTVGSLSGATYTIAAADVTPGADFSCSFANRAVRTVTLNKTLVPAADSGRFDLQVNGSSVATNVGNGGSGSVSTIEVGSSVSIAELAGTPNNGLGAYATALACTGTSVVAGTNNQSGSFTMPNADVSCTFTNTARVNLAISKTATPSGSYLPGGPLSYAISVTNNGPAAASGISVSDTVPAAVTVSAWSCSASGAIADCDTTAAGTSASGSGNAIALNAVALGAGESLSIAVTGTVAITATGSITNTATAAPPPGATCTTLPCSVSGTVVNTDSGTPQLTLVKSASPNAFAVGQSGTYTLQLSNSGTSSTVGTLNLSDPLPAGITTTATPSGSGWNCAASTTTVVSCTSAAVLPPGANAPPVTVPVTIAVGTASPAVNSASASGGGDSSCPAAAHCQGTISTPIDAPHLELTKSLQGSFVVGVQSLYVLSVANTGQAATLAGTITDTIPAGLAIGSLPAGCSASGQALTCTLPAGLAPGNSVSYSIPVTPQGTANGQSLTNNATVNGGGDTSCPAAAHCTGTTTDTVGAPQLSVVKTATPASFVIGVQALYTLQVTNTGSAATTAVTTVSDTVPSGLSIGSLPPDCSAAGQVVTCTIAAGLATGTPVSFAIPVTPQASLSGLSVTNMATATGGGDPSCIAGSPSLPPRCTGSTTTPIGAPMLDISKSASGANFVIGVPASYTLTVTNSGSAATTAVATISDTIPAGLAIGSLPAACSAAGQVLTCSIPAGLAVGTPVSFVIPVTPGASASGQILTNTASVSGGGDPTCPGAAHCESETNTPVEAPQLSIAKSASGANFVVGVPASYTLQVTNIGTAATTATATVSDTIPSSLSIGSLPPACSAASQVVTCSIPAGLASGALLSFAIPVTPTPAASGTTVTNMASVSGGGDPTCPAAAQCSSSTTTPVDAPQLSLVKTASASSFVIGVPASYTLSVTNTGTAATTASATVSDSIPGNLTIGTLPPGCNAAGQVVSCVIAAGLAPGAPVSFVITVTPTAAASGSTVSNSAVVSGGGDPTCPTAAHCGSSTQTPVNAPQLSVRKTASSAAFVVGVPASYTLQVTNIGSAATTATAQVSDTVPAGLNLGAMPAGCSASGQVISCTIASGLAAGVSLSFVIPLTATAAANGQTLNNTATVSGGGDPTCPAAARCSSSVSVPVDAPALSIVKTASASSFVVGVAASYSLTVTNTGAVATTAAASVSDNVPAGLSIGSLPPACSASGQVVSCSIATGLASGSQVVFVIAVTPTAAASGSVLTNTAVVSGGGDPACPGAANCSSSVNTPVAAPQLRLVKSASAASFVVGVPASYSLTATNIGSAATTAAASISDSVAASLVLGAMPAGCTASSQNVSCTVPAGLAAGASVTFVLPVTPSAAANGTTVTNTATVSGGGDPTCPAAATCSSSVDVPVQAPQLSIVKTASTASFVVGTPASYSLSVTNTGNAATTAAASVSDTVPAGLSLGTLPAGCSASGQQVVCSIAAGLAPGASSVFVIPVTPLPAAAGNTLTNTATVSGGGGGCAGSCTSTVTVPVGNEADLSVLKTAGGGGSPGGPISYTLTASNAGPNTAVDVSVTDALPAGLVYLGATGPGWSCSVAGNLLTCTLPSLANGASSAIVLAMEVPPGYSGATPILNTADIASSTPDPNPANNSSTVTTAIAIVRIVPSLTPAGLAALALLLLALAATARRRGQRRAA
ncbi:putative repeat protein (TIGR01451 family) [Tahibacter aquaticus]|uniref:Putative repeat protein (TIGR01451 family) n=1 Tax=Tahibacter aquaticus TaxID=520092 RepID=A0A4R6Z0A7_9GAMM|nr:DUF11 domain-containing protein [Tahibacter aquaticus]TDR44947.1 putative repeat protein (TIGR01451 family) [Tahibacter aquaticus]